MTMLLNPWYLISFCFIYLISTNSDLYGLRPDSIYISYFFFGLFVLSLLLDAKIVSNRNVTNFTEEMTYYMKMAQFFALIILDSVKSNYGNLQRFLHFYSSLISVIFEKYISSNKMVKEFRLRKKYYYLYHFCDRCLIFEQMVRKFIQQLFIKNTIKLTRLLIFRAKKLSK